MLPTMRSQPYTMPLFFLQYDCEPTQCDRKFYNATVSRRQRDRPLPKSLS
ncbi:MAG: hypothetical protein KME11_20530 [Timaviella obliquedivisa GSE-PSE-MK23-08B]|nr:hypothetical protein [Timaviella obliquedivisa GSE-PSE-MK23-08B]